MAVGAWAEVFLGKQDTEWLEVPIHALPFVNTGLVMDDGEPEDEEDENPLAHLDADPDVDIPVTPGMARL